MTRFMDLAMHALGTRTTPRPLDLIERAQAGLVARVAGARSFDGAAPTAGECRRLHRAATPSGGSPTSDGPVTLPPEMLQEASRRLGWAGLIYAVGYLLAYWLPFLVATRTHGLSLVREENAFAILSIALGASVFVVSRVAGLAPARVLDLGLGFFVLGSLGISLTEFWRGFPVVVNPMNFLGVPWEAVWILIMPLVAPNTPRRMLAASLASATTGPLVLAFSAIVRDVPIVTPVPTIVTYFLFTTYLCAGIAYVSARIVYRYGVRLRKAREIGSYELLEPIGEGGMGEVWVARHRMLARPSAVKLIRPELIGADQATRATVMARFEREARATAGLGSMHTVQVHDFGVADDGSFFYVMELLDGMSLDALVRRFGPQPASRVIHLLRQACHSLGEAHARGLVHRDVKPANIFTCRVGPDTDFVKVLDFGLVKDVHHAAAADVTAIGHGPGTPAYMAPEAALGQANVDRRADLYALGCVGYWLLTGRPVFEAETAMATILAHVQASPGPPSARAPMPVPAALDAAILACLSKDPADRPGSAEALAVRLAAIAVDDPWTAAASDDWWQQHHGVRS